MDPVTPPPPIATLWQVIGAPRDTPLGTGVSLWNVPPAPNRHIDPQLLQVIPLFTPYVLDTQRAANAFAGAVAALRRCRSRDDVAAVTSVVLDGNEWLTHVDLAWDAVRWALAGQGREPVNFIMARLGHDGVWNRADRLEKSLRFD